MKKLFSAIQKNDLQAVKAILDQSPALINRQEIRRLQRLRQHILSHPEQKWTVADMAAQMLCFDFPDIRTADGDAAILFLQ